MFYDNSPSMYALKTIKKGGILEKMYHCIVICVSNNDVKKRGEAKRFQKTAKCKAPK